MTALSSRERLINTFTGKKIDRIATYDIIHNVDLIEYLTGKKITTKNAEDITCEAISRVLDLVRHFSIPQNLGPVIEEDEDGFIHKKEWWTIQVLQRPFRTMNDVIQMANRDIERIYELYSKKESMQTGTVSLTSFWRGL